MPAVYVSIFVNHDIQTPLPCGSRIKIMNLPVRTYVRRIAYIGVKTAILPAGLTPVCSPFLHVRICHGLIFSYRICLVPRDGDNFDTSRTRQSPKTFCHVGSWGGALLLMSAHDRLQLDVGARLLTLTRMSLMSAQNF